MIRILVGNLERDVGDDPCEVVVHAGGVGYLVTCSAFTMIGLPQSGPVRLLIETVVRETDISLYGFGSPAERKMWNLLCKVKNIGPNKAIGMLAHGVIALRELIERGDMKGLSKIQGVGKTTAEALVAELQVRLTRFAT